MSNVRAAVERVLPSVRSDLEKLVRIRSVSADPAAAADVRASAEAVAELARGAGAADVEILSVDGGAPAVIARWPALAGSRRSSTPITTSSQPVSRPPGPAIRAAERAGRLYARGAADDKAGVMAHLAALRAYDGRPPVGVTLFVEGEEEIGSPTFPAFLAAHGDKLAADVIVVADSVNWTIETPSLSTSLRGLVDCEVEVRVLDHAVHSACSVDRFWTR